MNFLIIAPGFHPSVNPIHADFILNMLLMEQLSGTLVKERLGNTGETEPFLAKSWSVSDDHLAWSFQFRPGLKAEDGTAIESRPFAISLQRRLKQMASSGAVPAFDLLLGWDEFVAGRSADLRGLETPNSLTLVLRFRSAPDGLLQFLAMPTFGFFTDSCFDSAGKWKSDQSIVSSGPYRLTKPIEGGRAEIVRRADWPIPTEAPERVQFSYLESTKDISGLDDQTIVLSREMPNLDVGDWEHHLVRGAPIILGALILSPYKSGPFQDQKFRQSFRAKLWPAFAERISKISDRESAKRFYPLLTGLEPDGVATSAPRASGTPTVLFNSDLADSKPEYQAVYESILSVAEQMGLKVEVAKDNRLAPDWLQKKLSGQSYDLRFANVDIGGAPENWLIKMMFCSKIGVSFPDPSGRICRLTEKFSGRTEPLPLKEFMTEFDAAVAEDSSVIPLYHTGFTWYVGVKVDRAAFNPNTVVPRVELIRGL